MFLTNESVSSIIRQFYSIAAELERRFPKRSFTPDGHMVESLCEALAAQCFDLELLPASGKIHNARTRDKMKLVQIKSTQAESLTLRSDQVPQHLLVIKLSGEGVPELIYNGPGALAYEKSGRQPSNGQRTVRISTLRKSQTLVREQLPYREF